MTSLLSPRQGGTCRMPPFGARPHSIPAHATDARSVCHPDLSVGHDPNAGEAPFTGALRNGNGVFQTENRPDRIVVHEIPGVIDF